MASSRQISSLENSITKGKVFARLSFSVDKNQLDILTDKLNYISTPGAVASITDLRAIAKSVEAKIKEEFPRSSRRADLPEEEKNLRKGWKAQLFKISNKAGSPLIGFSIQHTGEGNSRIRTILRSLEGGSKAYTIFPVEAKALRFRWKSARKWVFAKSAEIPEREGQHFIRKTEEFARSLVAQQRTVMEKTIKQLFEQAGRVNPTDLRASDFSDIDPDILAAKGFAPAQSKAKRLFPSNYKKSSRSKP